MALIDLRARAWGRIEAVRGGKYFNHPGHDQKSHGRKGGGVRDELADAETIGELNAAAAAEFKRVTGRDIAVDMAGSDLHSAKENLEGVLRGAEEFPQAPLDAIYTYGPGGSRAESDPEVLRAFAVTNPDDSSIGFGNGRSYADLREELRVAERDGFLAVGTGNPIGTGLHEFGHIVAGAYGVEDFATERVSSGMMESRENNRIDYVAHRISQYASTNRAELAAEAIAEVMAGAGTPSDLSQDIYDETVSRYRARHG